MCDLLNEIYHEIYQDSFSYDNFNKRKMLQKAIYLLENMGVCVGEYSFIWDKYGPYSFSLDCDAQDLRESALQSPMFSSFAKVRIEQIREYANLEEGYNSADWMECIASLHYLKYVFRIEDSDLLNELKRRKSRFTNDMANKKALCIVQEMFNLC